MQKDNHQPEVQQKDNNLYQGFSLFIKDSKGMYLYRKSEKIAKAFFLLTQHLEDAQSIKAKLRSGSLSLMEKSELFLSSGQLSEDAINEVVLKLMSLTSLSDIALSARCISGANHRIILNQIEIFLSEIHEHSSSLNQTLNLIPATLFSVSDIPQPFSFGSVEQKDTTDVIQTETPVRQSSSDRTHSFATSLHPLANQKNTTAHKVLKTSVQSLNATSVIPRAQKVDGNKNQRQVSIIEAIKRRGESSIKDLTDIIKGCSEKTIQRELIGLVSSGVLLKTGERRWSRYSMSN